MQKMGGKRSKANECQSEAVPCRVQGSRVTSATLTVGRAEEGGPMGAQR